MQIREIVSRALLWGVGLSLAVMPSEALGQSSRADVPGDNRAVNFAIPGQFESAQRAAKENNRCLLIKGVAGGMDQKGATECTKGHW